MVIQNKYLAQQILPLFEDIKVKNAHIEPRDFPSSEDFEAKDISQTNTTSTFSDNLSLPIHRWFRYPAGFSANWVHDIIAREKSKGRTRVLDPFSGSGTVLLESEHCGVDSIGIEAHPFVARVAKAKLYWKQDPKNFHAYALSILERARNTKADIDNAPELLKKCYPPEVLMFLNSLRMAWELSADGSPFSELTWLALVSILRQCSPVGTAQWQYILPKKSKSKVIDPYLAFEARVALMSIDMTKRQSQNHASKAVVHWGDARECSQIPEGWANLIVTSPPYANNYDYADATRLEMNFFGEIEGWGDLQEAVRKYLIRSCTQHVGKISKETDKIIADPLLKPIRGELTEVCHQLEKEKENHGGRKQYNTMVAAYFSDLAHVWQALRRITSEDALVCFVIGDSAPYGIHVPVDKWLGDLAIASGFKTYFFEKTRDRNVKWKNRKHTVPLHEGYLWIEG